MVTLFTAKPQHPAVRRHPSAPAKPRRHARAALLAVASKLQ
jgi:hypothetical protein